MENEFDRIFDESIDRLNEGQSIDAILRLHPDHAEALRPLLEAVSGLHDQTAFVPSQKAKVAGKQKLLRARYEMSQKRSTVKVPLIQRLLGQPKLWAPIAAVLLMFLIGLTTFALIDTDGDDPGKTVATPETSTTPDDIVVADSGILEIRVTDAPNYDISAVYLTLSNIEVSRSETGMASGQQDSIDSTPWETVIAETHTFELLELRGGIEKVLGSKQLAAGHYTQIRLEVEKVVVTIDGEDRIAKLPSGKLKLVGAFDIEEGMTTALTLDFDAEQSVIVTGSGKVNFKPVVRIMVSKGK